MEYFKELVLLFLPENCYQEYFVKFNFFDVECFTLSLSKALSIGIILGSLFVKLPQIIKLLKSRSAVGLSLSSTLMDLLVVTIALCYTYRKNFPLTTWIETLFLAIQTLTIAVLIVYLTSHSIVKSAGLIFGYALVLLLLLVISIDTLWSIQIANMPLLVSGKLMQAHLSYKRGNTGQLSAATVFMLLGGSLARVFTSARETGDKMLIAIYIVGSMANAVLAGQMVYYWNVKDVEKPKHKKSKSDKKHR